MTANLTQEQILQLLTSALTNKPQEKGKDSINLYTIIPSVTYEKFLESFQCLPAEYINNMDLHTYIFRNINDNLNRILEKDRPIAMPNQKTKTLFFYIDGKWQEDIDKSILTKLYRFINNTAIKNLTAEIKQDQTFMRSSGYLIKLCDIDKYGSTRMLMEKVLNALTKSFRYDDFIIHT